MAKESAQQPYDNLLKRLLEGQPTTIIPLLLDDDNLQITEEINIEVLIPPRRTDRVYKSSSKGKQKLIHFEFESASYLKMDKRLLIYHALLFEKHELPVRSIIVYPFEPPAISSPLEERDGDEVILTFHYQLLPLGELNACAYVEKQAIPLYGLLPAMDHTTESLLLQAIEEMVQYYAKDHERLRDEMLCFKVLLERAKRLPDKSLQRVLRRIHMFDPLLEQDPWVQELRAQDYAKGEKKGKLGSSRSILTNVVRNRFPSLSTLAEAKVAQVDEPDILESVIVQISIADNEQAARKILESLDAL